MTNAQASTQVMPTQVSNWATELLKTQNTQAGCSELQKKREDAAEKFLSSGFPGNREEAWKYTKPSQYAEGSFLASSKKDAAGFSLEQLESYGLADLEAPRIVLVNGVLDSALSSVENIPAGASFSCSSVSGAELGCSAPSSAAAARIAQGVLGEESPFVTLNTACFESAVCLHISAGVSVDKPFYVVYISTEEGAAAFPRTSIVAEKGAEAALREIHIGASDVRYLTNQVVEAKMEASASFEHVRLQFDSEKALHVSSLNIDQEEKTNFATKCFSFGGLVTRNEIYTKLSGEDCETTLNGLSVLSSAQHVDNHTTIEHAVPNCLSNEWYKGVYGDKSKGVFNGTIIVQQDAQKTNAIQSNQALLLSEDAEICTQPQLKIWADDVACTHGATVGQLEEDAIFYLRSRGIPKDRARDMLIRSFAADITSTVEDEALGEFLADKVIEKLKLTY